MREAKFVQIAVYATPEDDGVFALDEDGTVWSYANFADGWYPLNMTRGEPEE